MKVFDSLYASLDEGSCKVVQRLFGHELKVDGSPKQHGDRDCGVFAIAISTCLAFGGDPVKMVVHQATMRTHLLTLIKLLIHTDTKVSYY